MKKHFFAVAIAALAYVAPAVSAADSDPVLMTVDGHDVRVSEFEYLFNKNNSQQLQQQSLDDYLQMFIDYKLKVADAEHAGLQNTPEFLSEFNNFRAELAAPYLRSQQVEDELVQEAYDHRKYDVVVSHIMLQPTDENYKRLDSIRTAIVTGKTTFEEAARTNSIDRASSVRGGYMGYVVPDRFPWAFEKASYDLKPGEISPIVNSGLGYHLVRLEKRTPASGEVLASHILRTTRGKSEEEVAAQKAKIDSLYAVLKSGADFADIASRFSEDPGSARNGGSLNWFGRGAMVAEFDSVAFALKDGEISEPFATSFGYHIIKRFDHNGVPELTDELRKKIIDAMGRDQRANAPEEARLAELMEQKHAALDEAALARVRDIIAENGGYDSTVVATLTQMSLPVASYDGGKIMIADVVAAVPAAQATDAVRAANIVRATAMQALKGAVLDAARDELALTNADYRNLVNEYRDGILLYEISNRNVWEKATADTEGLEKYFKAHAADYKWEAPRFKSFVFFATSDSVLNVAKQYADSLSTAEPAVFTADMRKRFGRDIKVERVIAAKGENAITDYLAFDGEKPALDSASKWKAYAAYKGRIIDAPEEAADVRGAAVTDYQAELDREWVKQLRKRYKVKLNKKVFEKLKSGKM